MKVYTGISEQAKKDLELIRSEMKKANPDGLLIANLLNGAKYTKDIGTLTK